MVQWTWILATKPDSLSSSSRTHRVKKKSTTSCLERGVACKVLHPILQILERGRSELFQSNIYKSSYVMEYTLNILL